MIQILGTEFPCRWLLLEFTEEDSVETCDITAPLNTDMLRKPFIRVSAEVWRHCSKLLQFDKRSGVMFDNFFQSVNPPAYFTFKDPISYSNHFDLGLQFGEFNRFYALSHYANRDGEVRLVCRSETEPRTKTDVLTPLGAFLYNECLFTGELPEEVAWGNQKKAELEALGLKISINHYKTPDNRAAKVYFRVHP